MFDGETYKEELDKARLKTQLQRTFAFMENNGWVTLSEIAGAADGSDASVSARIRDFRKERFGSHVVKRKRRGNAKDGIWEYKLIPNGPLILNEEKITRLQILGYTSYEKYLQSDHWRNFKYEYFSNHLYECSITRQNVDVVLHHISYTNLGKETEADVIPVSKDLHELIHKLNNDHNIPLKHCHKVLDTIIHGLAACA